MVLLQVFSRVGTLMLSFGLLVLATGTFNTFMGLRADLEGFADPLIGAMMSAFYTGLIIGAYTCNRLIARTGHIRAFTAFAALSAVVVLLHPFIVNAPAWIILRILLGFASAGLYMCTESWLNDRVTPATRGIVLSVHATVVFLGFGGGQLMLNAGDPAGPDLFMIAAILFALGAIPVALTRQINPEPQQSRGFGLGKLYAIAPTGVTACIVAGLSQASLFGMGPVFGRALDLSVAQISLLMTALIMSGLFLQIPLGWMSDRFDRRMVILLVALGGAVLASALIGFVRLSGAGGLDWGRDGPVLLALAFAFGGLTATLYPLGIAHANDYLAPEQRIEAAGGLVLAYGLGAVLGPLIAAGLMQWLGPQGLFVHNLAVAGVLAAFILYRTRRRSWAGIADKERFRPMPEATGTPGGVDYDPRWYDYSVPRSIRPYSDRG